jgi:hypothetical protein
MLKECSGNDFVERKAIRIKKKKERRPMMRWLEEVENDLKRMKVK